MKQIIKKLIPQSFLSLYHLFLAYLGAMIYGWPSRKMVVIGITGTKGKSTTCYLIAKILEEAGFRVGVSSTIFFKVAEEEKFNSLKMTMPGRFFLQELLAKMAKARCQYAVIETSSEGILQWRHKGIDYDVAVFTNLSPEHIEAHKTFENYKKTKGRLFEALETSYHKELEIGGEKTKIQKTIIANLDSDYASYFLGFPAEQKIGFTIFKAENGIVDFCLSAEEIKVSSQSVNFQAGSAIFELKLLGKFNIYNALAAICVALSQGIDYEACQRALKKIEGIPGRQEFIDAGQSFKVMVDYAHEPESSRQLYELVKFIHKKNIIQVFGSTGGGRDRSRRKILGELAAENADIVVVTTDDPYDDDPQTIIDEVAAAAQQAGKILDKNLFKILDRREAIKFAIDLAGQDDLVLITGKGCEQAMAIAGGKKIPWDDRKATRELLEEKHLKKL